MVLFKVEDGEENNYLRYGAPKFVRSRDVKPFMEAVMKLESRETFFEKESGKLDKVGK